MMPFVHHSSFFCWISPLLCLALLDCGIKGGFIP